MSNGKVMALANNPPPRLNTVPTDVAENRLSMTEPLSSIATPVLVKPRSMINEPTSARNRSAVKHRFARVANLEGFKGPFEATIDSEGLHSNAYRGYAAVRIAFGLGLEQANGLYGMNIQFLRRLAQLVEAIYRAVGRKRDGGDE